MGSNVIVLLLIKARLKHVTQVFREVELANTSL